MRCSSGINDWSKSRNVRILFVCFWQAVCSAKTRCFRPHSRCFSYRVGHSYMSSETAIIFKLFGLVARPCRSPSISTSACSIVSFCPDRLTITSFGLFSSLSAAVFMSISRWNFLACRWFILFFSRYKSLLTENIISFAFIQVVLPKIFEGLTQTLTACYSISEVCVGLRRLSLT